MINDDKYGCIKLFDDDNAVDDIMGDYSYTNGIILSSRSENDNDNSANDDSSNIKLMKITIVIMKHCQ